MSKDYELPFDAETGRFKAETILADLIKAGLGSLCELESAELLVPEDIFKLDFDFAPGSTEVRADISLADEVYEAEDFFEIISTEYEVELKVVPREYDASGGYGPGPTVQGRCTVSCEEVQLAGEWTEPAKSELPIPAVGDEEVELLLTVKMGGAPRPGLSVFWDRLDGTKTEGELDQVDEVTDEQGEMRLTYTAPELYYRPGDKFFEKYAFYTEVDGERKDLVEVKVPLAPHIKLKIEAEKKIDLDGEDYGLVGDLTEEINIDARDKVKIITAEPRIEVTAGGETRQQALSATMFRFFVGDESGVDSELEGIEIESDEQGRLRWELKELVEAFAGAGAEHSLEKEQSQLPELKLTDDAEADIHELESFQNRGVFPSDVYQHDSDLADKIRKYRFVFVEHLAKRETGDFSKARSAVHLMRTAAGWSGPFRTSFNNQFAPLLGKLGATFWDLFGLAWNVYDWGGKLAAGAISIGQSVGRAIADVTPGVIQGILRWTSTHAAGKLKDCVASLKEWIDIIGGSLPSLRSIWQTVSSAASKLFTEIDGLVSLCAPQNAPASEVAEVIIEWWAKFVAVVVRLIAGVFETLGLALVLFVGKLVTLATSAAKGFVGVLATAIGHCDDLAFDRAVESIGEILKGLGITVTGASDQAMDGLKWSVGKYMGALVDLIWNWVQKAASALTGGGVPSSINQWAQLNLFNATACSAVRAVHGSCEQLDVPLDHEAKREQIKGVAIAMKDMQHGVEMAEIQADELASFVDTIVLCFEAAMVLIAMFFSGGTLAAAGAFAAGQMAKFQALEVAISQIKLLFKDIPQVLVAFLGSGAIMLNHNVATHDLVVAD